MNKLIKAINQAVASPNEPPDHFVVALFQNDLRRLVCDLNAVGIISMKELDEAIRHVYTHIPTDQIKKVVKKWGRK